MNSTQDALKEERSTEAKRGNPYILGRLGVGDAGESDVAGGDHFGGGPAQARPLLDEQIALQESKIRVSETEAAGQGRPPRDSALAGARMHSLLPVL